MAEKQLIKVNKVNELWKDKYHRDTAVYRVVSNGDVYLLKYTIDRSAQEWRNSNLKDVNFNILIGDEIEVTVIGSKEFNSETQIKAYATSDDNRRAAKEAEEYNAAAEAKYNEYRARREAEEAEEKARKEAEAKAKREEVHTAKVNGKEMKYHILDHYSHNPNSIYGYGSQTIEVINPEEISPEEISDWWCGNSPLQNVQLGKEPNTYILSWYND